MKKYPGQKNIPGLIHKIINEIPYCSEFYEFFAGSGTHFGINADELLTITYNKLEVNKKRKWGNADKNGVIEHIKDNENYYYEK
jgi:hypothetical protein